MPKPTLEGVNGGSSSSAGARVVELVDASRGMGALYGGTAMIIVADPGGESSCGSKTSSSSYRYDDIEPFD